MKKINLIVILLMFFHIGKGQENRWSLNECINYALENNISIKQSKLDMASAEVERADALGNFLPTLNGNAYLANSTGLSINPVNNQFENTRFTSFYGSATSTFTIFNGLRNVKELQRAKHLQIASKYSMELMKDNIELTVINAYLQVLFNKRNAAAVKAQNLITQSQLERTNKLIEEGVIPKGDLLEVEALDAAEKQRIVAADNNVQISLINLAQILLIKDYKSFDIEEPGNENLISDLLMKSPESLTERAKQERYELKIAKENLIIAEKNMQLLRSSYIPSLYAFFEYDTRYADNDQFNREFTTQLYESDGTSYGLRLNIPIINGLSNRSNVQRSRINLERSAYQLEQTELDLEANVYQLYVDAIGAQKSYEAALVTLKSQEQAFNYTVERFEAGLINAFQFSQSKIRFENAQLEAIQAEYDYIFRIKLLEHFISQ